MCCLKNCIEIYQNSKFHFHTDFDDGSGELPNILQEAEMNVLSNDECIEEWGDEYIHPSQVCVEGENKSSCTVSIKPICQFKRLSSNIYIARL